MFLYRALILLASLAAGLLAMPEESAAQLRFGKTKPIRINAYGPWQVVIWGEKNRIDYCTAVRYADLAGTPNYGIRVDNGRATLSIQTTRWDLQPKAEVQLQVTNAAGAARELNAVAVSRNRADVPFDIDGPFLDELRRGVFLEVKLDGVSLRLPFDQFEPARTALALCSHIIGKELTPAPAPAQSG